MLMYSWKAHYLLPYQTSPLLDWLVTKGASSCWSSRLCRQLSAEPRGTSTHVGFPGNSLPFPAPILHLIQAPSCLFLEPHTVLATRISTICQRSTLHSSPLTQTLPSQQGPTLTDSSGRGLNISKPLVVLQDRQMDNVRPVKAPTLSTQLNVKYTKETRPRKFSLSHNDLKRAYMPEIVISVTPFIVLT